MWDYHLTGNPHQVDTDSPRNGSLDGNGNLAVTALKEEVVVPPHPAFQYTGAWMHTGGKFQICYGDLRARIKLPGGQGLRPTYFLMGADVAQVGWPAAGEIDIVDCASYLAGSAIHGPLIRKATKMPFNVFDEWHEFWLHWEPDKIVTGVDDTTVATYTPKSLLPFVPWIFNDRPMMIMLNVGVGKQAGMPDETTKFPATMLIDWIRYTPL